MSSGHAVLPRVRALDGVRGVAVIAVLLFHSELLDGGYLGVDLFFVLSGYLITSILLVEVQGSGGLRLLAFWARRARRLLPAMFLVVAAVAIYALVVAEPTELTRIRGDALATIGYVANWRFVLDRVDYWSLFQKPSPLAHTWSLAIEEQFYVAWPLVVLAVVAWGRRRHGGRITAARDLFWVAVVLVAAGAAWSLWIWHSSADGLRIYYGTDTRAPAILLGAAFGAWSQWRGPVRSPRARVALEVVGIGALLVLAAAWFQLDGDRLFQGGLLVCSIAALAVVAAAAHPRPGVLARGLSIAPLVGLGIVSYGLYLWHWPIYLLLDAPRTGLSGWSLFAVRFVVTLGVAIVSYLVVERPIRRGAGSTGRLRVLTPVLAAALVAVMLVSTSGADDRVPGRAVLQDPRQAARRAETQGAERVLVVGNSVANVLAAEGFAQVETTTPLVVVNTGRYSCDFPPSRQVRDDGAPSSAGRPIDCTDPWPEAVAGFDPDLVLMVFGDIHVAEYEFDAGWASACDPGFAPEYEAALDRSVAQLRSRGARVVLTSAAFALFISRDYYEQVRETTRCTNRLLRRYVAEHPEVEFVDLNRYLCADGANCTLEIDGAPLRPDGVHYRERGAEIVAAWMLGQIGIEARPPRV